MVQVLARQVLGGKCNMGNAVISVCSATPLGTHKENTEISPTETLQNHQILKDVNIPLKHPWENVKRIQK